MRLRSSALIIATCSLLLALLIILLGHVIPERIHSVVASGVVVAPILVFLVVRYSGGFAELVIAGTLVAAIGTLISLAAYYVAIGLQLQALGYWSVLDYLVMMIRSGVFIMRYLTDFLMGLAALLTTAGILAMLVVGE